MAVNNALALYFKIANLLYRCCWFIAFAVSSLLLSACETTGASPSFFKINALNSGPSGQVMAQMECDRTNPETGTCLSYGTSLEVQFEKLHDEHRYSAMLQRGKCGSDVRVVSKVAFRSIEFEPSEGILADIFVEEPIHKFLTRGNSIAVYDKRLRKKVACGNLQTDRIW